MPIVSENPWGELRREVDRSRRFEHEVTLLRAELPPLAGGRRAQRARTQTLARAAGALRTIDSVWTDGDAAYLLLPETDRAAAELVVSRLWRDLPDLVVYEALRMATFPADGVTPDALRAAVARAPEAARRRWAVRESASAAQPVPETEQR